MNKELLTADQARKLVAIANKEREQKLDEELIELYQHIKALASIGTTYTNWDCEYGESLYLITNLRELGYSAIWDHDNATIDISWEGKD